MNKTALIYDEDYLRHDSGYGHPESSSRLLETIRYLKETGLMDKLLLVKPVKASESDLERVHTREHIKSIKSFSGMGGYRIDGDTYVSKDTFEIARLAAGGEMLAGEFVVSGEVDNAYALVRPPGHHARQGMAAGFCYFNNVAVAIRYLQEKFDLERVLIFDWDAHAADGTMAIFWEDPSVLNISIHQDPRTHYPGKGFIDELGAGKGEGFTVNIPMAPSSGDSDYIYMIKNFVYSLARDYRPDLIVISAGMDSHRDDMLSSLQLTEQGYSEMTRLLVELAEECCKGRIFVELEGGYNLKALAKSNYEIIKSLLGEPSRYSIPEEVLPSTVNILDKLRNVFSKYHKL